MNKFRYVPRFLDLRPRIRRTAIVAVVRNRDWWAGDHSADKVGSPNLGITFWALEDCWDSTLDAMLLTKLGKFMVVGGHLVTFEADLLCIVMRFLLGFVLRVEHLPVSAIEYPTHIPQPGLRILSASPIMLSNDRE